MTKLFDIAANDFDAKKSAHFSRLDVVTQLDVNGIQVYSVRGKKTPLNKISQNEYRISDSYSRLRITFANTKIYSEQLVTRFHRKNKSTMTSFC